MIAADVAIDARSAPKLAHPNNQRGIEQPALLKIVQQGGKSLFSDGQMILLDNWVHPRVVEAMRVPAARFRALAADALREINCHHLRACFDEAPCQKAALPISGAAVSVAHRRGFRAEIERAAQAR